MKVLFISNINDDNKSGLFLSVTNRTTNLINNYLKTNEFQSITLVENQSILLKYTKKLIGKNFLDISRKKKFFYYKNIKFNVKFYYENFIKCILRKIKKINSTDKVIKYIYTYKFYNKLLNNISKENFDIIQVHWAYPTGCIANGIKNKYNIPYILTVHGSDIHTAPFNDNYIKKCTLETLENANKVVFVSKGLLNSAQKFGYSGNNAIVIPNGIDEKIFKILNKESIKKKLRINNKKVIGFVGNLVWVKRVDKFKEIFKFIAEKYEGKVEFLIVGDGDFKNKLILELKEINIDATFVGRVEPQKVAYYMNAMDIMILPSRNEGWPCVVLEAQACGVPVVGSNNGGIEEAIGSIGGAIVEDGENFEQKFAEEVIKQLNVNYNPIQLRNRALKYSWDEISKEEFKLYKEIINN